MSDQQSRRKFIHNALAAGTALPAAACLGPATTRAAEPRSANEKLNLAVIGVSGRGGANLAGVASENICVLCDVDAQHMAPVAKQYPQAATYSDLRRVMDRNDLDGVVVSTPDHTHSVAVTAALRKGLAVYCEKPLVHCVFEADYIGKLAGETACATQMGNQIHNHPSGNYRRVVETIRAGVLGAVQRVHIWMAGVGHFKEGTRVEQADVPPGLNYDAWLGPAPYRPYHPSHLHFHWRYWWDFGGGQLADFWCHYADLPFWALELDQPTAVHAVGRKGHDGDNDVPRSMQVDYWFAERGTRPAVHLTWYHGGPMPPGAEAYDKNAAVLFEGRQGRLLADYTTHQVFMDDGSAAPVVAPSIPDSVGHHREWIEAAKRGDPDTTCNFRYGALLTAAGLLGNVSYRAGQTKLHWNATALHAANCPAADPFIRSTYRNGWELA